MRNTDRIERRALEQSKYLIEVSLERASMYYKVRSFRRAIQCTDQAIERAKSANLVASLERGYQLMIEIYNNPSLDVPDRHQKIFKYQSLLSRNVTPRVSTQ